MKLYEKFLVEDDKSLLAARAYYDVARGKMAVGWWHEEAKDAIKAHYEDIGDRVLEYIRWYVYDKWYFIEAFTETGETWGITEVGDCDILLVEDTEHVKKAVLRGMNAADDYLHAQGAGIHEEVMIYNIDAW